MGDSSPKYSAISLFAGCGGSDLGLRRSGIEVVWANEKNESACSFYERVTRQQVVECADVAEIDRFPSADIVVGCYPCQGYSQGGKRDAGANINYLYRHFDRVLRQVQPLAFIVENVDGMRFSHNSRLLQNQLKRFRLAGYNVEWRVLNAVHFGVPQDRRRLFIVGTRSDQKLRYQFPDARFGSAGLKRARTLRDAIWRYRHDTCDTYNDEPFHWYYMSRNRRRGWDDPAATVVARSRHVALHPDSPPLRKIGNDHWEFEGDAECARRLSFLECAALQGFPFPERFRHQSLALRYRAIGNAVPPPLFAAVARQLVRTLERYP